MKTVWTLIMMQVFLGDFTNHPEAYRHTFIRTFDTQEECIDAYRLMVEMAPELQGEIVQSGCIESVVPKD